MRILLSLAFIIFLSSGLFAQKVKRFSNDPEEWIAQVQKLIKDDNKSGTEELLLAFGESWRAGDFPPEWQEVIVNTSNNFIKKRVIEYESWNYYLRNLLHLVAQEEEDITISWIDYFEQYSRKSPSKMIRDQLAVYYGVFYKETLFDDGSIRWKFFGQYEMKFEDEPYFIFENVDLYATFKQDST
jgi:hypothetical protein